MSGLDRYLDVVNLFGEAKPEWTIPEIAFSLDLPTSTVYRTVRELVAAEMLEPSADAQYRLGAAFIAFERRVRRTDSLIRQGGSILPTVAAQAQVPAAVVLARLFGDTVMCVADAHGSGAHGSGANGPGPNILTSYERGRPQPLMRGATSKMILAQLPARRLKRLLAPSDSSGPDGHAILTLRKELAVARRCGYVITRGEVDPGLVGIAAPVSHPEKAILASLSLIVRATDLTDVTEHRLVQLAVGAAAQLTERLRRPTDATALNVGSVSNITPIPLPTPLIETQT